MFYYNYIHFVAIFRASLFKSCFNISCHHKYQEFDQQENHHQNFFLHLLDLEIYPVYSGNIWYISLFVILKNASGDSNHNQILFYFSFSRYLKFFHRIQIFLRDLIFFQKRKIPLEVSLLPQILFTVHIYHYLIYKKIKY